MIFSKADILLPQNCDMTKWGTVACDQYTSEPEYWQGVKEFTKGSISAYNLILPEVYLEDEDVDDKIKNLNDNMRSYIEADVFESLGECYIYVERTLKNGAVRRGVVGAIDLEEYDYSKGSTTKVRATEKTVVERIPPRLKVRENASVELPHIMILVDDPKDDIINYLSENKDKFAVVYDFDLMMDSGHIKGYKIDDATAEVFQTKLSELDNIDSFNEKYGLSDSSPLVFAMGDGNHSLATAKEYYRQIKENILDGDPSLARYALCELVNLHDASLEFEAIHRVVFDVDTDKFTSELSAICAEGDGEQCFVLVHEGMEKKYHVTSPSANITVGSLQNFIDGYIDRNGGKVDYIHGESVVRELSKGNNIGIILDAMDKSDLFKTVAVDGALPRKTFSMGEACDKRFYVEARKIRQTV
ncbi:MAG: DUF1015 domain-containing protein [Clostridia bacterium]|nr:DUF1015 domain-containing protein [Clostridia bacterium]